MNRYLIFAGYFYYPKGGIDDLITWFESPEDALFWVRERAIVLLKEDDREFDWAYVVSGKNYKHLITII